MKMPPLHALMCCEAAARHMSIKLAAEELCVTASAVSQQIAKFEALINVRLFIRAPRGLALTDEGRQYLAAIRPAFAQIEAATQHLLSRGRSNTVALSCTRGFAVQWLLPGLAEFEQANPGVEVQIATTNRRVDLLAEGYDFAIRHGGGSYPGLEAERLVDDDLCPLCSPQLLAPRRALNSPVELSDYPLLHDEHRGDWALWFSALGFAGVNTGRGAVFIDSNGVLEAAIAGQGIALVRRSLARDALRQGLLVPALAQSVASPIAYYLVYAPSAMLQPVNRRFRDWITSRAAEAAERW
ncbi:transcriptional regulator GcvA [Pluralibacter gergoviae]|uniref:Transcriptional regulator GcvA n=1 Tax=Pluralibacter gergoviae TaxID=61647 RepID=A0AAI9GKA6_PLUGE|nr:transcriptional regulator GcvA [Pluralibacter gergoviae]EKV0914242.1 transcriptional regulator GcvA [Pluralibacter gergoviae]EKV0928841.1 transcriptional regulator GcvA [Pluralibacter gergoviae]EKV6246219.1 transcriptional regulator GcvA [Pluralibacter gergoviae]EKV9908430.1 transcriptional regulator GcvA [Pluralibacter gergoviae]EKW7272341.1 transcriptional regulator GcvA [Pluralibacter gergoviae]